MHSLSKIKIQSLSELYHLLPGSERLMVDVLRKLFADNLPSRFREKISYNVPFFYGNKGVCIIWPATIPRGGIKSGVLLGFWYGCKLNDADNYLTRGTNKQIFYKIYADVKEIKPKPIITLLKEAVRIDELFSKVR